MRYIPFVTVFLLLIASSCNLGVESSWISGNSYFKNEGKGDRMISSNNAILHKTTIYPDVVAHAYNDDFIIAKQQPVRMHWPDFLGIDLYTRYTSYRHYIETPGILGQEGYREQKGKIEWDSINYKMFLERGASLNNSSRDIQIRQDIADSLIDNDPYYKKIFSKQVNYWIIDNSKDTLIGPLTKEEYVAKRKELKIPDDLQFEE